MHVLDEEQIRLLLAEAKRSSRNYRLYLTAILTGMRQGELLGLRWKDMDFVLGTIAVQQSLYRLNREIPLKEPKSAKSRRVVDLPPLLIEELRCHREEQKSQRQALGEMDLPRFGGHLIVRGA